MPHKKHDVPSGAAPSLRILLGAVIAIGPGKAALLEAIQDTGSITAAAKRMKMSYARAWQLVDTMNQSFREPVVLASKGGSHGGGTGLTPFGEAVLARYRAMEDKARHTLADDVRDFQRWLKESS